MQDYYRFRFRPPDRGTPKAAVTLQDVVVMPGVATLIIGAMATNSAGGRGDLNLYTGTIATAGMFFWLMAKFAEDHPRVSRWLIIVPAALLALACFVLLLLSNIQTVAHLIALVTPLGYFSLVSGVAIVQLRRLRNPSS